MFVVSVGNSLVIKRVDPDPASRTIILYSANPAYEPRRFSGPETDKIRVDGKVVACYHKI
jgi:phage repressor protein C with HTH and peptisase S24 domain